MVVCHLANLFGIRTKTDLTFNESYFQVNNISYNVNNDNVDYYYQQELY